MSEKRIESLYVNSGKETTASSLCIDSEPKISITKLFTVHLSEVRKIKVSSSEKETLQRPLFPLKVWQRTSMICKKNFRLKFY